MNTYKVDDFVSLKANDKEGWKSDVGIIVEIDLPSGTAVVEVLPEDDEDDGLREITLDQIEGRL